MSFAALPFDEQLAHLRALVAARTDPSPLLIETAALPDPEPFVRLVAALHDAGTLDAATFRSLLPTLGDAALQHVIAELDPALLVPALGALSLGVDRLPAISLVDRFLRRHDPAAHRALHERARALLDASPTEREPVERDPVAREHALALADGRTLARLARDPAWAPVVRDVVARALDALARAPKSISQANAERLLARRVYADPGHFFFELVQNADDAGATRVEAELDPRAVTLRHDGEPFSLLDLVGVLSIGQTTKRADQIGFFGVGFKSVYEVCERPRIDSGALAFEIAHVSIPRALEPSSLGDATTLVLPLRDPEAFPAIARRASAIPPETLLTLGSVRALRVDGAGWRRADRDDVVELTPEPEGEARRYRVAHGQLRFEGEREEGRARESAVLVAARCDPDPHPHEGPTLYAFLPTAERTGLRVLVHARFDVTLDRERLELDSAWNDALLREAGRTLARLARTLGPASLAILSTRAELAPAMRPLAEACATELRDAPFLVDAAGQPIAPSAACLADPDVARALAGLDLGGRRALAPLDPTSREARVASELGVTRFDAAALVDFARAHLTEGAPPPPWLAGVMDALARAPVDDATLRALPLLVVDGALVPAHSVRLASPALVALYRGHRPLLAALDVPPALARRLEVQPFELDLLPADLRAHPALRARTAELFAALESLDDARLDALADVDFVPSVDGSLAAPRALRRLPEELLPLAPALHDALPFVADAFSSHRVVRHLVRPFERVDLAAALEAGLALDPASAAALRALLDRVAHELPEPLARRFAALPLFVAEGSSLRPLLGPERALPRGPVTAIVPTWPWLVDEGAFVRARRLATPDAALLARALQADPTEPALPAAHVDDALAFVAAHARELSRAAVDALVQAPVWRDVAGVLRPHDALRAGDTSATLDAAFSALGARHVASPTAREAARQLGLATVDDRALLVGDVVAADELGAARAPVLDALLECVSLGPALAPLLDRAIFSDGEGTLRPLSTWRTPSERAVHRAGAHRALLSRARFPLLPPDEERRLAPLLDALGVHPPTPAELFALAPRLTEDPDALLALARDHHDALDDHARATLAQLPLVRARDGQRRPARELVPARSLAPLDPTSLGLDDVVASDDTLDALPLPHADLATLFASRVLARLVPDEPLPPAWRLLADDAEHDHSSRDRLPDVEHDRSSRDRPRDADIEHDRSSRDRSRDADVEHDRSSRDRPRDVEHDRTERDARDRPRDAEHDRSEREPSDLALLRVLRTITERLGLPLDAHALALDAAGHLQRPPLLAASTAARALLDALDAEPSLRLAEPSLRLADPGFAEDAPALVRALPARRLLDRLRAAPERVPDEPLFAWLREEAESIAADPEARALLAQLPVFASQSGERRAPRQLVLDPDTPDLGLGWGLAPSVPADVADFLRATFELDRHARRAMVAQLLDALADAARADDVERARDLLAFLARALDADDPAELEERVRRLDVRARLELPVVDAEGRRAWTKPRFAWSPSDEVAAEARRFATDLPPALALEDLDAPSRRLVAACGARDDLDDAQLLAHLDRIETLGLDARRALARYLLGRARTEPARIERARLRTRAWLVASDGALRTPDQLVFPAPLAHALLGPDHPRFPDPELAAALDERTADRLGLRRAEALALAEVAPAHHEREAPRALLEWLQAGLEARRFSAAEVAASFAELRLRDDEGVSRPPRALARHGARALLGPRRGDWSAGDALPRLARALGIPTRPDDAFLVAFLAEVGASLERDPHPADEAALARAIPEGLARLEGAALPLGAALAVRRGDRVELARLGDPSLRVLSPATLADVLPTDAPVAEVLLREPDPRVEALLVAAGVPDLFVDLEPRRVLAGATRDDPRAAELARRLGRAVVAHDALSIDGLLHGAAVRVDVDAALDGEVLRVTPDALAEPARVLPALSPAPEGRAAIQALLTAELPPADAPPLPKPRLFERVRRFFARPSEPPPRPRSRAIEPSSRDARLFAPRDELTSQLDRTEGWLDARREVPQVGFAFSPSRLAAPWVYAPQLVTADFVPRGQRWTASDLPRPSAQGEAGVLLLRGRLPAGESVLPLPLYGELVELRTEGAAPTTYRGGSGMLFVRLEADAELRLRVRLGVAPRFEEAIVPARAAPASFVPDAELPDEVLDFVASLDDDDAPFARAIAIRDFVRRRYRYDPTYLEDPAVGRYLARLTRGRAHAHVAALHVGADAKHLGAGVCYELNALVCELLRRAGIPAALATGWVFDGGSISEPDHLWTLALLEDARGRPVWLPLDASSTEDGRPLQVPRRPPVPFRAPADPAARAPRPTSPALQLGRDGARASSRTSARTSRAEASAAPSRPKKKRIPRAELFKLLHHLGRLAGEPLSDDERAELERALHDPKAAAALLRRLRSK